MSVLRQSLPFSLGWLLCWRSAQNAEDQNKRHLTHRVRKDSLDKSLDHESFLRGELEFTRQRGRTGIQGQSEEPAQSHRGVGNTSYYPRQL